MLRWVRNKLKRRKYSEALKAFESFIASPFDLGNATTGNALDNGFTMPAAGRLAISLNGVTAANDLTVAVDDDEVVFGIPGAGNGTVQRLGWVEEDEVVTVNWAAGSHAGKVVSLYVLDEWMRPFKIAEGDLTS